MNVDKLHKALPFVFKSGITPLLVGHRGVGKSSAVKQFAQKHNIGFIDLRLGQMADAGDILGLPEIIDGQTSFMTPKFFPKSGEGILFLDEINRVSNKDILQAVFQLILDRKVNDYTLPEGWHVVAAKNPPTKEYMVFDFNDAAFNDRFMKIKFETSVSDWVDYAREKNLNSKVINFFNKHTDLIEPELSDFSLDVQCSKRSAEFACNLFNVYTKDNLNVQNDELLREMMIGLIGVPATAAFFKELAEEEETPKATDVINNYEKVRNLILKYSNPDSMQRDVIHHVSKEVMRETETIENFSKEQLDNILQYILDIPKDSSAAFLDQMRCENGLANQKFMPLLDEDPYAQKIIDNFKGFMAEIKAVKNGN